MPQVLKQKGKPSTPAPSTAFTCGSHAIGQSMPIQLFSSGSPTHCMRLCVCMHACVCARRCVSALMHICGCTLCRHPWRVCSSAFPTPPSHYADKPILALHALLVHASTYTCKYDYHRLPCWQSPVTDMPSHPHFSSFPSQSEQLVIPGHG